MASVMGSVAISQDTTSQGITQLEPGFGGKIKLGCWQPFVVTTTDQVEPNQFEITVLDGDETPVTYRGLLHSIGSSLNTHQGYVRLGKSFGDMELKLFDRMGAQVSSSTLSLQSPQVSVVSPTDRFILTIERDQNVLDAIVSTTIGQQSGVAVKLERVEQLPTESFCYDGINALFLNTSNLDWLSKVTPAQWTAIEQWVVDGGQLILSISADQPDLFAEDGSLARLLPGKFVEQSHIRSSNQIDNFASASSTPLVTRDGISLPVAVLEDVRGRVILEQEGKPMIIRTPLGLGEVTTITFDLDHALVQPWPGFKNLVYRLQHHVQIQDAAQSRRVQQGSSVSHPGFQDLIGQLRVPLDQFSKVRFLPFSWIALLIGLYILCIGPGDYFLLRRLTGKMELTWITFPLISLLFCGLAWWIAQRTRSNEIQLNQLEMIDIDLETQRVRGTVWSNLYSPSAGTCDLSLHRSNRLGIDIESDMLSWHGLPGKGYGSMETQSGAGISRIRYAHSRELLNKDGSHSQSKLLRMPTYVSATQPLLAQYRGTFGIKFQSNLRYNSRSQRIEGTLVNPFDFPLKNCRLIFGSDAYLLSAPLEPGDFISVESEMQDRPLVSHLTRRRTVEVVETKSQNTQNLPWNVHETRISRIADLLMFYSAAGGSNYTAGLTHDYQSFIDMSGNLGLGRAILVAEVEGLGTSILIDDQSTEDQYDKVVTLVRIVLPVTFAERRR